MGAIKMTNYNSIFEKGEKLDLEKVLRFFIYFNMSESS